jgi:hypothetical protein
VNPGLEGQREKSLLGTATKSDLPEARSYGLSVACQLMGMSCCNIGLELFILVDRKMSVPTQQRVFTLSSGQSS